MSLKNWFLVIIENNEEIIEEYCSSNHKELTKKEIKSFKKKSSIKKPCVIKNIIYLGTMTEEKFNS